MKKTLLYHISRLLRGGRSTVGLTLGLVAFLACLQLRADAAVQENTAVITFRTDAPAGTTLRLYMEPFGDATVDGLDKGEFYGEYMVTEATREVTITGRVTTLECYGCRLTALNVQAPELAILKCYNNKLASLDVSGCPELAVLDCSNNSLTSLDVSDNGKLETLKTSSNSLQTLTTGVANTVLERIECGDNALEALDVSACGALADLYAENNRLATLDLSGNTALWWLKVYGNNIAGDGMESFAEKLPQAANMLGMLYVVDTRAETEGNECWVRNVATFKEKGWVACDYAGGVDNGTMIGAFYYGKDYQLNVSNRTVSMTTEKAVGEQIVLDITGGEGDILISGVKEAAATGKQIYTLTAQDVQIKGDVTKLVCSGNGLTSLEFGNAGILTELDCSGNAIKALDMSGCPALTLLYCQDNDIRTLNLSGCTALMRVSCYLNSLKAQPMTDMMASLCDGTVNEPLLFVVDTKSPVGERNICLKSDVDIAAGKKWTVKDYINGDYWGMGTAYAGTDPIYYAMTIEESEHGRIEAGDGLMLQKILNGTVVKLYVYPDDGYELESLTANGEDITEDMAVEVMSNVIVRATFRERTLPESYIRISRPTKEHVSLGIVLADKEAVPVVEGGTISVWNGSNLILSMTEDTVNIYGDIETLQVLFSQLTYLDVSHCPTIKTLNCGLNDLKELDLSNSTALATLSCEMNLLTGLDLSACPNLTYLNCYGNNIAGESMTALVESLPVRTKADYGQLIIIDTTLEQEGNVCLKSDVSQAMAKYWAVFDLRGDVSEMTQYFGSEPSSISSAVGERSASYDAASGRLVLPAATRIEVFSVNGTLLRSCIAGEVDLGDCPSGIYIIRYEGKTVKVVKR